MYQTKAFWGLESNTNAATLNTSFNNMPSLIPIFYIIVIIIGIILIATVKFGFG